MIQAEQFSPAVRSRIDPIESVGHAATGVGKSLQKGRFYRTDQRYQPTMAAVAVDGVSWKARIIHHRIYVVLLVCIAVAAGVVFATTRDVLSPVGVTLVILLCLFGAVAFTVDDRSDESQV